MSSPSPHSPGVPDTGFTVPAGVPWISHLTLLRAVGDCDHTWISCLPAELESEKTRRSPAKWRVEVGCGHVTERQSRVPQTPSLLTKNEVRYCPVFGGVHLPQTSQLETENLVQLAECLLIGGQSPGSYPQYKPVILALRRETAGKLEIICCCRASSRPAWLCATSWERETVGGSSWFLPAIPGNKTETQRVAHQGQHCAPTV